MKLELVVVGSAYMERTEICETITKTVKAVSMYPLDMNDTYALYYTQRMVIRT